MRCNLRDRHLRASNDELTRPSHLRELRHSVTRHRLFTRPRHRLHLRDCSSLAVPAQAANFRWANDGDVGAMDPYTRQETVQLSFLSNIYEPLVRWNTRTEAGTGAGGELGDDQTPPSGASICAPA